MFVGGIPQHYDRSQKWEEENKKTREIAIRLEQRQLEENAPKWKEKQMKLYDNLTNISSVPSLGEVIQNQMKDQVVVDKIHKFENVKDDAKLIMQKYASEEVTDYVLKRLSDDEMQYLIYYNAKIIHDLKKNNTKIDKDTFVRVVQDLAQKNTVPLNDKVEPGLEDADNKKSLQRKIWNLKTKYRNKKTTSQNEMMRI